MGHEPIFDKRTLLIRILPVARHLLEIVTRAKDPPRTMQDGDFSSLVVRNRAGDAQRIYHRASQRVGMPCSQCQLQHSIVKRFANQIHGRNPVHVRGPSEDQNEKRQADLANKIPRALRPGVLFYRVRPPHIREATFSQFTRLSRKLVR